MGYQNISVVMTQADVDAVKAAYVTIATKMPFLISLTPKERRTLTKLGPKSVDFATEAQLAGTNFPTILPATFSMAEYNKDTNLFKVMTEIKLLNDSLTEKISDTFMAVGSESFGASRTIYDYVKAAMKTNPGLKSVYLRLKERFKNQGKKKGNTPSGPTNP